MLKHPRKSWKNIGKKCFGVLKYGSGGYGRSHKKICRTVYTEKKLAKGHPTYWFELYPNQWRNTTKKGVKTGIVASVSEFWRVKKNLK